MNPAWQAIATFILRNRIAFLVLLAALTTFMWFNRGLELNQSFANVILTDDPALKDFKRFKELFGDDANAVVVSIEGNFRDYELFKGVYDLSRSLQNIHGVKGAFGLTQLYDLERNDSLRRFELVPVVQRRPQSQAEVDSLMDRLLELPFYQGLLLSDTTTSTLLAISMNASILNTDEKVPLVNAVKAQVDAFADKYGVETHLAGLPMLRANMHRTVKKSSSCSWCWP
jgi:uncharacterized protein